MNLTTKSIIKYIVILQYIFIQVKYNIYHILCLHLKIICSLDFSELGLTKFEGQVTNIELSINRLNYKYNK